MGEEKKKGSKKTGNEDKKQIGKPCKDAIKHTKNLPPFPDKELQEIWKDAYLGIDSNIHCLDDDLKQYKAGKVKDKLMTEVICAHLNNALSYTSAVMELLGFSLHLQYHTLEESKSLQKIRKELKVVEKDLGQHKPILEYIHKVVDKTIQAEKHGQELYQ